MPPTLTKAEEPLRVLSSRRNRDLVGTMQVHSSSPPYQMRNSPATTPQRPLKPRYGDRFMPVRVGNTWQLDYPVTVTPPCSDENAVYEKNACKRKCEDENRYEPTSLYAKLVGNEILGCSPKRECFSELNISSRRLFHYDAADRLTLKNEAGAQFALSPLSKNTESYFQTPNRQIRKIPRSPFKVLDAPELQDDFYLNLVDWSSQNVLTVGLGSCVYLWNASDSQVHRLCDYASVDDIVTSVSWNEKGNLVAVGTNSGCVQIWDAVAQKQIVSLPKHTARVGALAWNSDLMCSGSRDRYINQTDIRSPTNSTKNLIGHRQEVCGLKWSTDNQYLASGGNDNKLFVWDLHHTHPIQTYEEHTAAVKAIAWSPHHHGLLASGGGTADRCIRFWNTLLSGQSVQCIDTGSQVCNLVWSKNSLELVSTHGYSQNQILVWKYPSLHQVTKLTGHTYRVLYLAMSPNGESIVTGAGDETLRFWNVFSKTASRKDSPKSVLSLNGSIR